MLSALMLHEAAKLVFTLHFKMPCCSTWTVVLASTWAASPLPPSAFAPYLSAHYRQPLPLIFCERSSQGALNLHARAPFFLQFNARYSKGSVRLEPNASPAQSDSLLPNEMKQGWGQVPRGHWIIAHSQVNSHDENTAVNVYYQMPFSTAQDKALLLQQVCVPLIRPRPSHSPVSAAPHCAAADCATCCVLGHRQPKVLRDITHGACCA